MVLCVICQVPIIGRYKISPLGESLCGSHPNIATCRWCARFASLENNSCRSCKSSGVTNLGTLHALSIPVLVWLETHFGAHWFDRATLRLSKGSALQGTQYAETRWTQDQNGFRAIINVVYGIPELNAKEALAHEYGHLLLATDPDSMAYRGAHGLSAEEEEGFCEVLRALWIDHDAGVRRNERRDLLEKNSIDLYRVGFAQMWPQFIAAGSLSAFRESALANVSPNNNTATRPTQVSRTRIPVATTARNQNHDSADVIKGRGHRPIIRATKINDKNRDVT